MTVTAMIAEAQRDRNIAWHYKIEGKEHQAAIFYDRAVRICIRIMEEPAPRDEYNAAARLRSQCIDEESS